MSLSERKEAEYFFRGSATTAMVPHAIAILAASGLVTSIQANEEYQNALFYNHSSSTSLSSLTIEGYRLELPLISYKSEIPIFKTDLARKLYELRMKAIDKGTDLLDLHEITNEVKRRRGEIS